MAIEPVCGNDPYSPENMTLQYRATLLMEALITIDALAREYPSRAPILSIVAAFMPIAVSLTDELERMEK